MGNEYIIGPDGELYHHGVKGMKWGVRKDKYKAMSSSEKKTLQKEYWDSEDGKASLNRLTRNAVFGTILGGPVVGTVAAMVTLKRIGDNVPARDNDSVSKNGSDACDNAINKIGNKSITNMKQALKANKSYHDLTEQERNSISRSYEDKRSNLVKKINTASSEDEKQKIVEQIDRLENDYLYIIERD